MSKEEHMDGSIPFSVKFLKKTGVPPVGIKQPITEFGTFAHNLKNTFKNYIKKQLVEYENRKAQFEKELVARQIVYLLNRR